MYVRKREIANSTPSPRPSIPVDTQAPVVVVPSTSDLLARSLGIINNELTRLQRRSNSSGLEQEDVRMLRALIQSLVEVSAEERAISRGTDLDKMSDEELRSLASKLLAAPKDNK